MRSSYSEEKLGVDNGLLGVISKMISDLESCGFTLLPSIVYLRDMQALQLSEKPKVRCYRRDEWVRGQPLSVKFTARDNATV